SRAAILDAAQKVFLANGYSGGSLTAIADVAGIPRTTIYEYFPSKGHILLAVIEDRLPPLLAAMLERIDGAGPLDTINRIFAESIDMVLAAPELAELMFRVARELPKDLRDQMWDVLAPVTREIFRQCRAGAETGEFVTKHPERCGRVIADMLVSAIDELTQESAPKQAASSVLASRISFIRGGLLGA
ncbi:MAG: TetR/AcrR family transcriptional regulator, partial [Acidimicrobiia bacterium]|nr:TetR/AcrR family transcriptional regulator [Acidimicrobiia bacterium]